MIYYAGIGCPRDLVDASPATLFLGLPGAATILMHIVAIGWLYVVLMMSLTENSFVAGVMTFVFYGALPVGILWYLSGSGKRRARARAAQQAAVENQAPSPEVAHPPAPPPPPDSISPSGNNRDLP
jgi:hypothetical protein